MTKSFVILLCFVLNVHAQENTPVTQLNINNLAVWVQADGLTGKYTNGYLYDAITYPAGKVSVVYQDGFVWGGLIRDGLGPLLRVGGNTYSGTNTPGIVQPNRTPGEQTRVWRIRKDFATADLLRDTALFLERPTDEITSIDIETIRSQYKTDWLAWPAELGAPFYDADGDGIYSPQFDSNDTPLLYPVADEPGYANADQVIWLVYNDADSARAVTFAGSPPIGLETQVTLWAYQTPVLENVIYKRWKMIYKGTHKSNSDATIDSMFVCTWADTELGRFGDDLLGFDLERMMVYTYNSQEIDEYYTAIGSPPPALGFDLIAGPIIQTENPADTAIVDFRLISGWKNLVYYTAWLKGSGSSDSDPNRGNNYNGTLQWFNIMRGFRPRPETPREPFINPWTFERIFFSKTGDPVLSTGWLDEHPGDRRVFPSTGPFTMALGDTQEVAIAIVIGQGEDRLDSIIKLRQNDDIAQAAFDNNAFQSIPSARVETQIFNQTATIKVYAQADSTATQSITGQLVDAQGHVHFTEPSVQPHVLEMHLDNITQVDEGLFLNLQIQNKQGQVFLWPRMQNHITTSGPMTIRSVQIFDDNINADGIANPGEFIRFGVTLNNQSSFVKTNVTCRVKTGQLHTYQFAEIAPHSSMFMVYDTNDPESYFVYQIAEDTQPGQIISIPVQLFDQKNNIWHDTLRIHIEAPQQPLTEFLADHVQGNADGQWGVRLMDLGQLKDHEYRISYNGQLAYNGKVALRDLTTGKNLFSYHEPPTANTLNMPVIDGFRITLGTLNLDSYSNGWSYSNENERWFASRGWDDLIHPNEVYPGAEQYYWFEAGSSLSPAQYKDIEIRFVEKTGFTDLNGNGHYDIGEPYTFPQEGTQKGWFYTYDRSNPETYEGFYDLPFTVWDISSNPPRQLAVVLNDWDENLQWDLRKSYQTGDSNFVDVKGGKIIGNFLFILDLDYDPQGLAFDASTSDKFFGISREIQRPILWTVYLTEREGYEQLSSADTLQLFKNTPPTAEDIYTFNPYQLFVGVQENPVPDKFQLLQNYPNPFNPRTSIAFSLPKPEHVQLKIYNILGQEIATLIDKKMAAGNHVQVWQGLDNRKSLVASGVFFYKVTAGKFKAVKKMAVVR
ncbi:MAG: T9SS C-terminal target domain-containing protein [Calditrichaeota bacterium]|nr:MAG: T9SS C-terminal target domain-containing protein [Calditrichota bacterium]